MRDLVPAATPSLLDIGCGPIGAGYAFADLALRVTAIDWRLDIRSPPPANVTGLSGDFLTHDFGGERFATIVCSDVFEHIRLESEAAFADKCISLLASEGRLIVTVPHAGTFGWIDPYGIRPRVHHLLHRVGLYRRLHNGTCDIRKGHRHYRVAEIAERFRPLEPDGIRRWGYLYEPLSVWAEALARRSRRHSTSWLERKANAETDSGERAYNLAIRFRHPQRPSDAAAAETAASPPAS